MDAAEELASPSPSFRGKSPVNVYLDNARDKKMKVIAKDDNTAPVILLVFKHLLLPKLVFVFAAQ